MSAQLAESSTESKYSNIDLDNVGDLRIFTEQLLSDYKHQNKRMQEMEVIVKQLTSEQPHEKSDERRINLLKMQVLQLERQIQCLYESIKQRTGLVSDSATTVYRCCDDLRHFVSQDVGKAEVTVPRRVLISSVERLNGVKNQLSQSYHVLDAVALGQPVLFDFGSKSGSCLKEARLSKDSLSFEGSSTESEDLSLLSLIVSTTTVEEKLKLVSLQSLEALVSNSHKSLLSTKQALNTLADPLIMLGQSNAVDCIAIPLAKLDSQISESLQFLETVSSELLLLNFILPQLNKPTLKKSSISASNSYTNAMKVCGNNHKGSKNNTTNMNRKQQKVIKFEDNLNISQDSIYKAFAPYLKSANVAGVSQVINSFLECMNLQTNLCKHARETAEKECKFYTTVHELQIKYQTDLFELIQAAFESFNRDLKRELCDPLAEVLDQYEKLTQKPTDESLKSFLKCFKQHSEMISQATYAVLRNDDKGQSAISEFGSAFSESVERLRKIRLKSLKNEVLALEDAENDWKRFLIYSPILDRKIVETDENSSRTRSSFSNSKPTSARTNNMDPFKGNNIGFDKPRSVRSSSVSRVDDSVVASQSSIDHGRMSYRGSVPQVSPTHAAFREHGLPTVVPTKGKKKRPPKISAQNPLPDMEF